MNTRILLAIVGAAALSACAKNKITATPDGEELPPVEPARPLTPAPAPRPATPPAPVNHSPGSDLFRQPDPTKNLPTLGPASATGSVPASPKRPLPASSPAPPSEAAGESPPAEPSPPSLVPIEAPGALSEKR